MEKNGRTLSREELYELIWSMPATKLAKEFGISDVGLGKICKRMEIPKPTLGYWRKVEVGGRVPRKAKLKKLSSKGQQQATIRPAPPESQSMKTIRKAEAIPFPDELVAPHRLTKKTFASFNKAKTDEREILLSRNKVYLDIHVTQDCLDRACLIMDTLIKEIESRGFKILTIGDRPLKTIVEVDDEHIEISLDERVRRTDYKPTAEEKKKYKERSWMLPRYEHHPTGNLSLNIRTWQAPRKKWSDGKRQNLENCLGPFIQSLRETASCIKSAREQHRIDEIRWAEEKKLREERERLERIEKRKAEKLMADANDWHQAERIRSYIQQVESLPEISLELADWIEWCKKHVSQIDPLNNPETLPLTIDEHSLYY
ncbi:hypothetical protein Ga0123461_0701 [Mariprofundus aestuarium]|uniref:Uncharacterized protein n=1 Tax=Mariprofundus aestuarium TaxID=1921086 RepID=A0A2K8KW93_MARES|nr:hypothetical protein [Mariprofundus aestuarium]ATX79127.1 hypothetical protein Ga0123461_0701 [Mariprofundus aestuarium]